MSNPLPAWPEGFEKQPAWVIQSASADQPNPNEPPTPEAAIAKETLIEGFKLIKNNGDVIQAKKLWKEALKQNPKNLWLARAINRIAPEILQQRVPKRWHLSKRRRVAVLIPGELRCLNRSASLLKNLSNWADLFICTTAIHAEAANGLRPKALAVIEQNQSLQEEEQKLAVGSMKQWHKYAVCCRMIRQSEQQQGVLYKSVLKLRTDYFLLEPQKLEADLTELHKNPYAGLIGSSDKIFAGRRDLMLILEGFWMGLRGRFLDVNPRDWSINTTQILQSDDCVKWFGLGFPKRIVGEQSSVKELRAVLEQGGQALAQALSETWLPNEPLVNFFPGHPHFPSEVAFARFLNGNGIPMREQKSLRGFLYSDRSTA